MAQDDQDILEQLEASGSENDAEVAGEAAADQPEASDTASETVGEAEPLEAQADASHRPVRPGEHTAEISENQEEVPLTLEERLDRLTGDVNHLLWEKEAFMLTYIMFKVPKPYYDKWKS